jgi:FkbM family methyltransferase
MSNPFKSLEQFVRRQIKHRIIRKDRLKELIDAQERGHQAQSDLAFLGMLSPDMAGRALALLAESPAQLRQDLFVLSELSFKREGFFVEFGAADGYNLSNSWLLEKRFGWRGILSEPARCWHEKLAKNRSCHVDHRCVWSQTGATLEFNEVAEISTVTGYGQDDAHHQARQNALKYPVPTISLMDLMAECGAPPDPDYLSIDTEGSEFEILSYFDFKRYPFKVITCEHNYTPMREKLHALLTEAGYVRKFERLSLFDDWYVRA